MSLPIEVLLQPLNEDQVFENFLTILESLNLPARSWRQGGVARTILRVVARTYSGFTELMASAIQAGFLETARGPWLTTLARSVYGVERRPATFATGFLRFANTGGGVFSFGADEVRALNPTSSKAYTNTSAFALAPGETKLVPIRAVEAGGSSSTAPNTITELETVLLRVGVTNPAALAGSDEEADEELRQRCRTKLAALSVRGPRGAYEYAVRSAARPDGSPVDINRLAISPSSSTGRVTIYCATPTGAPTPVDLDAARASIEAIARPDSVTVDVFPATEAPLARAITIWARRTAGVSASDIANLVQAALLSRIRVYPIGGIAKPPIPAGYLYADYVSGIAGGAHPSIFDVDGFGTDVALKPSDVVTLATSVDVRLVDVP